MRARRRIKLTVFDTADNGVLSWRWACKRVYFFIYSDRLIRILCTVYLNLPVCLVALVVMWFSLREIELGPSVDVSWRIFGQTFDFFGL